LKEIFGIDAKNKNKKFITINLILPDQL